MPRRPLVAALVLASLAGPVAAAHAAFAGNWYITIAKGPAPLHGRWLLEIPGNGTFWVQNVKGKAHQVDGKLAIKGSVMTFTDRAGPLACRGASAVGRYSFRTYAPHHLRLTVLHDTCAGRRALLTAGPFTALGAPG